MDLKLLATTFAAVFLAELGDKTQLATMGLAAGSAQKWMVFFGAALALLATTALAVLGGDVIARYIPLRYIERAAGALFVVIGLWTLYGSFFGETKNG
jgi:Ca2+/H+ antiporter, TMEM165/GDT1 family